MAYMFYDFTPEAIPDDLPLSKFVNKVHEELGLYYARDGRTGTIHALPVDFVMDEDWYFRYLKFLNDIVTLGIEYVETNDPSKRAGQFAVNKISQAQALIGAGFVPLVVEPSFTSGQLGLIVKKVLDNRSIPYKETMGILFTRSSGYLPATMKDIWVHRADFNKGNPRQVTTKSIWKELGIGGFKCNLSGPSN